MGANIFHCGGPGTGEVAKLCNNLAMAVQMVGTAEALNMGENLGMDAKVRPRFWARGECKVANAIVSLPSLRHTLDPPPNLMRRCWRIL